jgi:transposase
MPKPLVTDELWAVVEPLLPKQPPKPKGGRPRVDDRDALSGILFVLKTAIPWEMLPQEMGCGSGMTCWRRLKEWHAAEVWERLHEALLDRLGPSRPHRLGEGVSGLGGGAGPRGGEKTGPNPTDRGKQGSGASAMLWSTGAASRSR